MAAVGHTAGDAEAQPFEPRLESRVMDVVMAAVRARLDHANKIPETPRDALVAAYAGADSGSGCGASGR